MRDKITGPWFWMIAPTEIGQSGAKSIDIDSLAVASDGAVTEMDVATNGVAEGDRVGNLTWKLRTIAGSAAQTYFNNVNDLVNEIGWGDGDLDAHSSYALINLAFDPERPSLAMQVGSDDAIKVWLNGEVVHNNPVDRSTYNFQDTFKINLKAGDNLLLVKVSDRAGGWGMIVGITDEVVEYVTE